MSATSAVLIARTCRAEWSRLWTVRSTWVFVGVTGFVVVGFAALLGAEASGPSGPPADATAWDAGRTTTMFALFGVLALSALATTADHTTGGIVPTLQWTPRRTVLLVARTTVVAATTTAVGVVLVTAASLVVLSFVPEVGAPIGEGVETLAAAGFVLAAGAALAVGLGLVTRSTAGALVSVVGLVLVLPFLLAQLSVRHDWLVDVAAALPGSSALFLVFGEGPSDDMTTSSARTTFTLWAVAALVAGGLRLLRSDADR
ncbi:hypothetical protein [Nocardioides sp. TF02-7]|uniref:hypothetical protein n=1 Tax=Nocardioides sp. TF02-7 TaxID=2917724 RepID=UPI001F052F1E|nr:hypothetical protein [Nocardioides sp. TF02-7]UMG91869.1 hypothetical protein MF408_17775 [Nocardioides sp. TF02-7]